MVVVAEPTPSSEVRGAAVLADPLVRELLAARLVGVLATLEPDGSVHAVPMWLAPTEDAIALATASRSRKLRNIERDSRATLVLHDSRAGLEICGASIRGRVAIVRGEEAVPLIRLVHRRYVADAGLALPETEMFLGSDDVALRLMPEAVVTWDERGSAATRAVRESGTALPLEPTAPRP
jgi:PPOX class probable F420-dependent enzyme